MTKPIDTALIVDTSGPQHQQLAALLKDFKWRVRDATDQRSAIDVISVEHPALVLINARLSRAGAMIDAFRLLDREVLIVVVSDAVHLVADMETYRHKAMDFITRPVVPIALEFCLARMHTIIDLRTGPPSPPPRSQADEPVEIQQKIETERMLAVRQVLEKMSFFITQVAGDVEGGVKYFNELPYFISVHSRAGKVLAANPTHLKYIGNRVGQQSWEIFVGKRGTRNNCPVGTTLASGNVHTTRALVKYSSGSKVPVIVHTAPIYDNEGDIILVLEVFAGTKEIERLAQEIKTTQQRYQRLFDAVPCHVAVLDRRYRLTAVNRRFKEDFGDPTGRNFFDILRPGSFPAYRDPLTRTVQDGMARQGEMVLTDPNDTQYNMMVWTAPIKTASGKLIQVLAIFADITELRRLQDNLAALGLMIGTISHALKGSLTGLDAGLYLIDTGFYRDKPGRIEEGLDVAKMMVERIRKLVSDILYSARERDLQPQQVDVIDFVSDVAANVENRIRGADVAFQCRFEPHLGTIEIDPGLVRAALINILENAMEACIEDTSQRSCQIGFNVRREKEMVVFDITDNGSGMPAAQSRQIFEIFYSSKGRKGTGLGLFITNKVIKKHGGSISVESTPGSGTTFRVRLNRRLSGVVL